MPESAIIRIEPFRAGMLDETVTVLARAFVSNPVHVAAFGAARLDRNEAFFRIALRTIAA